MIFVTLGSQKFQFNRLLEFIDTLIEEGTIKDRVFAQGGYSNYTAENYTISSFLTRDDFKKKMYEADIVITHAGTGAIVTALKNNKKVIAIPRDKSYGEHVDNHQYEITDVFQQKKYIQAAVDLNSLRIAINEITNFLPMPFISNNKKYLDYIKQIQ